MSKSKRTNIGSQWCFFIFVLVAISCATVFGIIRLFRLQDHLTSVPSIELTSTDYQIREGDEGEIFATLLYSDGHTEEGRFEFEILGEKEGAVSIADGGQESGSSHIRFTAAPLAETSADGCDVSIRVSCISVLEVQPAVINIQVIPRESAFIDFEYYRYNAETGDVERCVAEDVAIRNGQQLQSAIDFDADEMGPYRFSGWYVADGADGVTDIKFDLDAVYYSENWAEKLTLRARYEADVVFDYDKLTPDEVKRERETVRLAYGDDIGDFVPAPEGAAGWDFAGWVNPEGVAIDFGNDLFEEGYADAEEAVVYSSWSTRVSIDTVLDAEERIEVRYGYPIGYSHDYSDGARLEGLWYSEEDGSEKQVIASDAIYTFGANMSFTAEFSYPVRLYDWAAESEVETDLRIVYGESLSYSGRNLPLLQEQNGWTFVGWNTAADGGGTEFDEYTSYTETKALALYSVRKGELDLYQELDGNGNASASSQKLGVVYGSALNLPRDLTAGSWTFFGWFTEEGGQGERASDEQSYKGEGSGSLYAAWQTELSFDYIFSVSNETSNNQTVFYKGEVEYPEPLYSNGARFAGWYYLDNGEQIYIDTHAAYTLQADLALTAEIEFTIDLYDMSESTGSSDEIEDLYDFYGTTNVLYNKTLSASGNTLDVLPDKAGWEFTGWYTRTSSDEIELFDEQTVFSDKYVAMTENGTFSLYSGRTTSMTLFRELDESGNSDAGNTDTLSVVYGFELELPDGISAGEWTFGGWYTQAGGAGEKMENTSCYVGAADVVLYAKWSADARICLTFADRTTGAFDGQKIAVTYNAPIYGLPAELVYTANGGKFFGWYTEKSAYGSELVNGQTVYNVSTLTIYDAVRFTLTFVYTDGAQGNNPNAMDFVYGRVIGEDGGLPVPQMDGWNFEGWYTQSGVSFGDGDIYALSGNYTVYDRWNKKVSYVDITGAMTDEMSEQTIYYGNETEPLLGLSYGSWTFGGWYTEEYGNGERLTDTSQLTEADTALYAYWYIESVPLIFHNDDVSDTEIGPIVFGKTIEESTEKSLPDLDTGVGKAPPGFIDAVGWFVNGTFEMDWRITDLDRIYPAEMTSIELKWNPNTFNVTFDFGFGSETYQIAFDSKVITDANTGGSIVSVPVPEKEGHILDGYYCESEGGKVFYFLRGDDGKIECVKGWDMDHDATLTAEWRKESYRVTFDSNGGSAADSLEEVTFGDECPALPVPQRTGYVFGGWYMSEANDNGTGTKVSVGDMIGDWSDISHTDENGDAIVTLYAKWEIIAISKVVASPGSLNGLDGTQNVTISVTSSVSGYVGNYEYRNTSSSTPGVSVGGGGNSNVFSVQKTGDSKNGTIYITVTDRNNGAQKVVGISYSTTDGDNCFAKGSLITLADGSSEKVENLHCGDEIMVFNHYTGELDSAPVSYIFYGGYAHWEILNLNFSDGTVLQVIEGHGLFDKQLNEYVVITKENVENHIGHLFSKIDVGGDASAVEWVELVSYSLTEEYTESYSILSAVHINHIVNGLLAVTDDIEGLYNIFELDDDMTYDKEKMQADIEKYGTFTYEEWSDKVTYEQFVAFGGEYLKVSVGKGLTTMERLMELIDVFLS